MSNRLSLRLLFQVLALLLFSVAAATPIAATSVESQQSLDSAQLTQADTLRDLIEERGVYGSLFPLIRLDNGMLR